MKYLYLLFCFLAVNAYADTQITEACQNHANALLTALRSEVFSEMTVAQSEKVFTLATISCEREFSGIKSSTKITDTDHSDGKNSDDWFTDFILKGEQPDKEGNKRLRRMNRR